MMRLSGRTLAPHGSLALRRANMSVRGDRQDLIYACRRPMWTDAQGKQPAREHPTAGAPSRVGHDGSIDLAPADGENSCASLSPPDTLGQRASLTSWVYPGLGVQLWIWSG